MAVKSSPSKPVARQPRPSRETRPTRTKPPRKNDRFAHDLWGVGLMAFGAVLMLSLVFRHHHAALLSTLLANAARDCVGVGAFALPLLFFAIGLMLIQGKEQHTRTNFTGGSTVLYVILLSFWHLSHSTQATQFSNVDLIGGYVGWCVTAALRSLFNDPSCYAILVALAAMAVVWMTDMRLLHLYDNAVVSGKRVTAPVAQGARSASKATAALKDRAVEARERAALEAKVRSAEREEERRRKAAAVFERTTAAAKTPEPTRLAAKTRVPEPSQTIEAAPVRLVARATPIPQVTPEEHVSTAAQLPTIAFMPKVAITAAQVEKQRASEPLVIPNSLADDGTASEYTLPPLTLLNESPPVPERQEKATQEKQAILMQTLNDFKIGANVAQIAMGPTVTRYEVQLEPGILVKKIVSLADNLAMSLAAIDVRVEAPIPGKSAIGIEVPNDVRQMVSLRECLATNEFMGAPSKLTFALGKDVSGEYKYADLTRMPHLLVGGSTNSGKSVCLNVLICSILYRATPREVKFIMIDPKRVELSLYDGIPHLLAPVIKDVKQAAGILRSVLKEMEERYDRFARIGTRNIDGYNGRVGPEERLPFIVVVIDELADLMMQQGPEVETSICRLAQLARATGIHLVIATQRPSVDVITGTIKANISSRIAFSVATQIDSRTIIDMAGADRLIGKGDMLFMPIDAAKPVRIQNCYIGERETETLVKYLRDQEEAVYTMIPSDTSASGYSDDDDDCMDDELFEPCVRWLVLQGQCSTSSLQRKFKIGYTRAARLVEAMEAKGIVGSQDGVKPREILLQGANVDVFFAGSPNSELGR